MNTRQRIFVGCQSWGYDDWITQAAGETIFYPRGTRQSEMLPLYAEIFDTIEVDATAYGMPQASTIESWNERSPDGFIFSLKVPSQITHELSLGAPSFTIMDEFVSTVCRLGGKLGIILIQFPASFESTKESARKLRDFLSRLPKDLRFAVEFRHPGWFVDWTFDELNEQGVALCLVAGKWVPRGIMFAAFDRTVTDFAYVRFMGLRDLDKFDRVYRDRTAEIELWKNEIVKLGAREVFVYADNYFEGHAPATARKLQAMLDLPVREPAEIEEQLSLF